jgi:flagellar hook-associated protein 2
MTSIYPSSNSTSSTSSANLMRISGMASGIDTDALVKSMVSNYQSRIDKANQAKQTVLWQQEGYRDIIKGIKGLQDYFDPLSSKYMMSGNSFNTNEVTNSDSAIVSATVSSSAKVGTYKVNVSHLAEQAKIEGNYNNSMVEVTELSKWSDKTLNFGDSLASIKLNITTDTIPDSTNMVSLVADINRKISESTASTGISSLNGKISASYVTVGDKSYIKFIQLSSDIIELKAGTVDDIAADTAINDGISSSSLLTSLGFKAEAEDVAGTGSLSFTLANGATDYTVSLTVGDNTTIQDLMDKVNSETSGAVTMSIDDTTGKISFESKEYGSSSSIKVTDTGISTSTSNNVMINLGLAEAPGSITGAGIDAIVSITEPGQTTPTTTTQSSNQFTVNGVSYNLSGVNELGKTSNVNVTANSETAVTNVKKFVEDYNTIISTISTKLTEKKDRDYIPLTDDQRESMSEDQIKTWEIKAKVGILRKDDYLSSLMSQLRGTLYSPVYNSYDNADTSSGKVSLNFGSYGTETVGIETSEDLSDGGKLVIKDELKLKNAIENNIEDFKKLFIGSSSSDLDSGTAYIGSAKYNEDGIFKRMDTIIRDYVAAPGLGKDGTYTTAGYMNIFVNKQYDYSSAGTSGKNTLPDQVYNKVLSVSKFQTQLEAAQTRYYAKFTALEKAMNALNSQQSALTSMLGTS